jgi:putative PEP-CTERM system TPR-repeat lipoprotein
MMNYSYRPRYLATASCIVITFSLISLLLIGCKPAPVASETFERASELQAQNDLSGAVSELKALLLVEPNNSEARWRLGLLYVRMGNGAGALKEISRAEKLGLVNKEVSYYRLSALQMTRAFQQLLEESQEDSLLGLEQRMEFEAQARFGLGQIEQAKLLFEDVLKTHPNRQPAIFKLALIAKHQGELVVAEEYLNDLLQLNPAHYTAWFYKADIRLRAKDFDAAEKAYQQALALYPSYIDASLGLVKLALARGDTSSADSLLTPLLQRYPYNISGNYLNALSAMQRDEPAQARSILTNILQRASRHQDSLLLLGAIEYKRGNYPLALNSLLRAGQSADKFEAASRLLAASYLGMSQPQKAVDILLPLLEQQTEDLQSMMLLAMASLSQGEYDLAHNQLASVSRLIRQGAVYSRQIAVSNLAYGDGEPRVSEDFSAVTLHSQNSVSTLVIVMSNLDAQRYERALQSLLPMLAKKDKQANPLELVLLGAAHEGLGDTRSAQTAYKQAVTLAPDYIAAQAALKRVTR